ncbi:MAG: hypothetical protein ACFCVC_13550 [Acidimicrobiia bacterium]
MAHPFEVGMRVGTRWVVYGVVASVVGFLVPHDTDAARLWVVGLHVTALTVFIFALTHRLAPVFDPVVFDHFGPFGRRLGTDASLVALVTGATALVTLASSATLGYQPSLQFLQLISALDIAWTTAGFYLGVRRLSGARWAGPAAGVFMGSMCVMALVRYLMVIGFGADGGWDVQSAQMLRLVIPADTVAAALTIGALVLGARAQARRQVVTSA